MQATMNKRKYTDGKVPPRKRICLEHAVAVLISRTIVTEEEDDAFHGEEEQVEDRDLPAENKKPGNPEQDQDLSMDDLVDFTQSPIESKHSSPGPHDESQEVEERDDFGEDVQVPKADALTRTKKQKPREALPDHVPAEYHRAIELALAGHNVFISGPAGSGMSTLAFAIAQVLRLVKKKKVQILAPTAETAQLVAGMTIHRYMGLGLAKGKLKELIEETKANPNLVQRSQETEVLVIDEASTADVKAFCDMHCIAKHIRKEDQKAFGGIQLIVAADFYGLPPVTDSKSFIFQSQPWLKANFQYVELTQGYRYEGDPKMQQLVLHARTGEFTLAEMAFLRSRIGAEAKDDGIWPTIVTSATATAERTNQQFHQKLSGAWRPAKCFPSKLHFDSSFPAPPVPTDKRSLDNYNSLKRNLHSLFPGDKDVKLCQGSQVMLLVDWEEIPRGARGIVKDFEDHPLSDHMCFPIVDFPGYGKPRVVHYHRFPPRFDYRFGPVGCDRIPLVEAFALTIFKVQGTNMAKVVADVSHDLRRPGQAYTAISRVPTREGLFLTGVEPSDFDAKSFTPLPSVTRFYASLKPSEEVVKLSHHVKKKLFAFYETCSWRLPVDLPSAIPSDLNIPITQSSCSSSSLESKRRGAMAEDKQNAQVARKMEQKKQKQFERQRREEEDLQALGGNDLSQGTVDDERFL